MKLFRIGVLLLVGITIGFWIPVTFLMFGDPVTFGPLIEFFNLLGEQQRPLLFVLSIGTAISIGLILSSFILDAKKWLQKLKEPQHRTA